MFTETTGDMMLRVLSVFLALLALQPPVAALAGAMQVSPTKLELSGGQRTATVQLQNRARGKANVQVRVFKWTQVDGEDVFTPTSDVAVSPPAASLMPDQTYTFRVLRKGAPAHGVEEAYRLFIDELPNVNVKRPSSSVTMVVRQALPVFVGDSSMAADLQWRIRRSKAGYLLEATNRGTRHAKLTDLTVGGKKVKAGLAGYVLPGATMRWQLGGKVKLKPGSTVEIRASGSDYGVASSARVEQ